LTFHSRLYADWKKSTNCQQTVTRVVWDIRTTITAMARTKTTKITAMAIMATTENRLDLFLFFRVSFISWTFP